MVGSIPSLKKIQSDNYAQYKGSLINVTLSAAATLTPIQENIELDTVGAAGPFTVTLPPITNMTTGKVIWFKDNGNAETNNVTIIANTGDGSSIDDGDGYVVDNDNRIVKFELIDNRWMAIISDVRNVILGSFSFADNATGTVITTQNTFTDIAGVGVASLLNNNFVFTEPPNILENTFDREYTADIIVRATVSRVSGNAGRDIAMAIFQDTGTGFNIISDSIVATTMTGDLNSIFTETIVEANEGDRFKAMVENRQSLDDVLFSAMRFGVFRVR